MLKISHFGFGKISFPGIALALLLLTFGTTALAQGPAAPPTGGEEKAEQILKRAVEALGGASYLNVHTVVSRGQLTPFKEGISGLPTAFVDYVVYPNRERTEFRSQGVRVVQVNAGDGGWVFDGAARTIKDMTHEQAEEYVRFTLRTSVENLLRGGWRKDGAKLAYVGRREAGIARRNEVVRLTYADGMSVEFEFGAKDGLPAKVLYQRKNADGEEAPEEDRLAQHIAVGGVVAPFVIDHYRAGVQAYRINYEAVEFNVPVADALFTRPANPKAVK